MSSELVRVEEIQREVAPVLQRAGALQIVTPADYAGAADFLKTVKVAEKRVVDFFAPMVAANLAASAVWRLFSWISSSLTLPERSG